MVKKREIVESNASKIFIDRSGTEQPKSDPVLKRIRDIHIKAPVTPQEFLQPIAPNLERTPGIQLKQVPVDVDKLRLDLEKKVLEDFKKMVELQMTNKVEDKNLFIEFAKQLPDNADRQIWENAFNLNPLAAMQALKSKGRIMEMRVKAKTAKDKKVFNEEIADIEKRIKELTEKNKAVPTKTDEKGKQVPIKK